MKRSMALRCVATASVWTAEQPARPSHQVTELRRIAKAMTEPLALPLAAQARSRAASGGDEF